jgi:hypothetical protein
VKEIHGYEAGLGLKLLKPSFLSSVKPKVPKNKCPEHKKETKPELAHA